MTFGIAGYSFTYGQAVKFFHIVGFKNLLFPQYIVQDNKLLDLHSLMNYNNK